MSAPLGLDHAGNGVDEALRVVAGIGVRAFGEEDADEWPGPLALRGSGERRGGDLVAVKPAWEARRSSSATIPASASLPRRWADGPRRASRLRDGS
jgi:hypothetical protein